MICNLPRVDLTGKFEQAVADIKPRNHRNRTFLRFTGNLFFYERRCEHHHNARCWHSNAGHGAGQNFWHPDCVKLCLLTKCLSGFRNRALFLASVFRIRIRICLLTKCWSGTGHYFWHLYSSPYLVLLRMIIITTFCHHLSLSLSWNHEWNSWQNITFSSCMKSHCSFSILLCELDLATSWQPHNGLCQSFAKCWRCV